MRSTAPDSTRRRPRWIVAAVVLALPILGCQTPPRGSTRPAESPTQSPAEAYQAMVDYLASDSMEGRGVGTDGLVKARDYIEGYFRDSGLAPAAAERLTQPFTIAGGRRSTGQSLSVANAEAGTARALQSGHDFTVADGSASGAFDGPAVFVGYGIVNPRWGYNSYAGSPNDVLTGKVAVAFRFEPADADGRSQWATPDRRTAWSPAAGADFKAMWAANRGAKALLLVDPPHAAGHALPAPQRSIGTRRTSIPVLRISQATFKRILTAAGYDPALEIDALWKAADAGATRPQTLERVMLHGYVNPAERTRVEVHNVVGRIDGGGALAEQVVVVGAHYDHIGYGGIYSRSGLNVVHPGADDNASGTAGLLLMARRFALAASEGRLPANRRTLLFAAFTAEERGLLGSAYMVAHLDQLGLRDEQVVAMVNMDMIGWLAADQLNVHGVGSGSQWPHILNRARKTSSLHVLRKDSSPGGSDHMSFHIAGIPALQFSTGPGFETHLHKPEDTPDRINAPGAVRIVDFIETVIREVLVDPAAAGE